MCKSRSICALLLVISSANNKLFNSICFFFRSCSHVFVHFQFHVSVPRQLHTAVSSGSGYAHILDSKKTKWKGKKVEKKANQANAAMSFILYTLHDACSILCRHDFKLHETTTTHHNIPESVYLLCTISIGIRYAVSASVCFAFFKNGSSSSFSRWIHRRWVFCCCWVVLLSSSRLFVVGTVVAVTIVTFSVRYSTDNMK